MKSRVMLLVVAALITLVLAGGTAVAGGATAKYKLKPTTAGQKIGAKGSASLESALLEVELEVAPRVADGRRFEVRDQNGELLGRIRMRSSSVSRSLSIPGIPAALKIYDSKTDRRILKGVER